jgi:hypothetical protein
MNSTVELLRVIGSPFAADTGPANMTPAEAISLYGLAVKNKIGLFYLETLRQQHNLNVLEEEYQQAWYRRQQTTFTAVRISRALDALGIKHALFKQLKPFPATPSDVDVMFFGPPRKYKAAIKELLAGDYFKISETPSQVTAYDLRGGYENMDPRAEGGKEGGIYYLDLYKNFAASHIRYLDKAKLHKYTISAETAQGKVTSLDPKSDLVAILVHSIFPEQLFVLGDYYSLMISIDRMDHQDINEFLSLVRENNVASSIGICFAIAGALHKSAFGFIPDKIEQLVAALKSGSILKTMESQDLEAPYRYPMIMVVKFLIQKMYELNFAKSAAKQLISMANPWTASRIIRDEMFRRVRETY